MDTEDGARIRQFSVEKRGELEDTSLGVRDLGDGTQSHEQGHFVREVAGGVLRQGTEHLGGALRMPHIGNLLPAGLALDCINDSRQVIGAHVEPREIPELLLVVIRVQADIRATVGVPSRVSQPDIIAGTSGHERRSHVRIVHDPAVGRVQNTMLEKHRWL